MEELLQRLRDKTEDHISRQGGSYFMCGNDLLNIINEVENDIQKNLPIYNWREITYEEAKRYWGTEIVQYWTDNNNQWNVPRSPGCLSDFNVSKFRMRK